MNATQAFSLIYEKLMAWLHAVVLLLPNIGAAIVVVIVFRVLSKLIGRLLQKLLSRLWSDKDTLPLLVSKTASAAIVLIGLLTALSILDLDKTVTSLLAGVGVIGIALGFAFQDIASNFMSGVMISLQHPCQVGDLIKTGNYIGKVEKIALRSTTMRTFQGPLVLIPNKDILQSPLTNFTRSGHRRVEIRVGVAYGADLERVKRAAVEAVSSMEGLQKDREVELHFEELDESSINFVLWLWVDYVEERDYVAARSEAIIRITKAFAEEGISFPGAKESSDSETKAGEPRAAVDASDAPPPRAKWKGSGKRASEGVETPGPDGAAPADADDKPGAGDG